MGRKHTHKHAQMPEKYRKALNRSRDFGVPPAASHPIPPRRSFFCTIIPYTVKLSVFRPSVDTPRRRSCFDLAAGSFRVMTTCLFTRSSRVGTASPSLRRRKNESFLSSTAAASSASENRLNPARRSTRPCGRFTPQWNVSSGGERKNYPEAVRRGIYKWTSDNVVLLGVAGVGRHQRRSQYVDDDLSLLLVFELASFGLFFDTVLSCLSMNKLTSNRNRNAFESMR